MDLNALVRFVFLEKNDITFGILIGLTLIVVILLLVRSVIDEKETATSGGAASVDSKTISTAIEGALKKALASGAVVGAGASTEVVLNADGTAAKGSNEALELKKVLSEREAKISSLLSDLEVLKSQADSGSSKSGGATGGADSEALLAKINELQAKLSEYEIIEDDIADLSSYKEENKKLKDEIEKLRVATTTARDQVQTAQQTVADPTPAAVVQAAQAAVLDVKLSDPEPVPEAAMNPVESTAAEVPAAVEGPKKPVETFVLDTTDDVMGEFAKALTQNSPAPAEAALPAAPPQISAVDEFANLVVSGSATVNPQAAIDSLLSNPPATDVAPAETSGDAEVEAPSDPFGALDTEKMLAEVASMGEASGGDTSSVLEEALDTDRLMAEMGMSEPKAESPEPATAAPEPAISAPPAAAVPAAEIPSAVAPPPTPAPIPAPSVIAAPTPPANQVPVDDLLAEFNDTDFQAKKDSKE